MEMESLIQLYIDAFSDYPKLEPIFPDKKKRMAALEASLRFYTAYDLRYGKGYSLDGEMKEAILLVESEKMRYSVLKHLLAGSYSAAYKAAMSSLTKEEKKQRMGLFAELDRLETDLDLPEPHLYVDFLGVRSDCQRQGRGRRLLETVCVYAEGKNVPIMLFTNTKEDVLFYKSAGFTEVGITRSEEYGFENTYLVKYPEKIT